MLMAKARSATPFMYDFHFYHHVQHPYVQGLRRQFVEALRASPPRFIVEVTSYDKFSASISRVPGAFPELRNLMAELFRQRVVRPDYVIYERIAPSQTPGGPPTPQHPQGPPRQGQD